MEPRWPTWRRAIGILLIPALGLLMWIGLGSGRIRPATAAPAAGNAAYDWPTLAHDMDRTGATTTEPLAPYTKQWYRDFWAENSETISDNYQAPAVYDSVHNLDLTYVGTINGSLYALNLANGATYWRYPAPGSDIGGILSSPTIANGIVYVGALDGNVYALDGTNVSNGVPAVAWVYSTGRQGGFSTTPAVYGSTLYIGGRDGYFYAINTTNGALLWQYQVGAQILTSPAYDSGTVYFAAENMHAYALNASNGSLVWESPALAGQTFRNNYPVVTATDVIFRTAPADDPLQVLPEEEQVLAFAAGCTSYPKNPNYDRTNAPCFTWSATPSSPSAYTTESQAVVSYLSGAGYDGIPGRPQYETFHVLQKSNGQEPFVAPVLWTAGNGSPGVPPVLDSSGRLWVLYRSYYSNYVEPAWFIMNTFGQLNMSTGSISIRDASTTPTGYSCDQYSCNPWFTTNVWMIGDETTAFSVAGNEIVTNQWSGLGTVDLTSGQLTSIIGERDNFVAALDNNATRPGAYGTTPQQVGEVVGPTIYGPNVISHYNSVVFDMVGTLSGSTPTPQPTSTPVPLPTLTATTAPAITIPSQSSLTHYVWEYPEAINVDPVRSADLVTALNSEVSAFLSSGRMGPWLFIPGKTIVEGYLVDPAQTQYYLALAYPYLSASLQSQVVAFIHNDESQYDPLTGMYPLNEGLTYSNGQVTMNPALQRLPFPPGPQDFCAVTASCEGWTGGWQGYFHVRQAFDRLYDLWTYAYRTGDWSYLTANWSAIVGDKSIVDTTTDDGLLGLPTDPTSLANLTFDDSANRRLAALIAYTRIANHMNDATEVSWGQNAATLAMQARLRYVNNFRPTDGTLTDPSTSTWLANSSNCEAGGMFIQTYGCMHDNIPEYRELTPEVARLLADYAAADFTRYDNFLNTVGPFVYLQQGYNESLGEVMYSPPTDLQGEFLARAMVDRDFGDQLRQYLDVPWLQSEDYFYWERQARTADAYGELVAQNVQYPTEAPVPIGYTNSLSVTK